MKIGTCVSQPGKSVRGDLIVCRFNKKTVKIPVVIIEGIRSGSVMCISAGMHGDEFNGVEILHRFIHDFRDTKKIENLHGTIVMLPVQNPSGFKLSRRRVAFDNRDLNRCFPGTKEPKNALSVKIAKKIFDEVFSKCHFGIDIHDSGSQSVLMPHSRVHSRYEKCGIFGCTKNLGLLFGTEIVTVRSPQTGMLAKSAHDKQGKSIVTVEIGGAKVLWENFIPQGVQGLYNVLIRQKMLSGKVILPEKQYVLKLSARNSYYAPKSGLIKTFKKLGDAVRKGEKIIELYDPVSGKAYYEKAKYDGILFSLKHEASVKKDEVVFSILEYKYCPSCKKKVVGAEEIINKKEKDQIVRKSKLFRKALKL